MAIRIRYVCAEVKLMTTYRDATKIVIIANTSGGAQRSQRHMYEGPKYSQSVHVIHPWIARNNPQCDLIWLL
jgi:hypothetical protein